MCIFIKLKDFYYLILKLWNTEKRLLTWARMALFLDLASSHSFIKPFSKSLWCVLLLRTLSPSSSFLWKTKTVSVKLRHHRKQNKAFTRCDLTSSTQKTWSCWRVVSVKWFATTLAHLLFLRQPATVLRSGILQSSPTRASVLLTGIKIREANLEMHERVFREHWQRLWPVAELSTGPRSFIYRKFAAIP